jgi:hypothetical protein
MHLPGLTRRKLDPREGVDLRLLPSLGIVEETPAKMVLFARELSFEIQPADDDRPISFVGGLASQVEYGPDTPVGIYGPAK